MGHVDGLVAKIRRRHGPCLRAGDLAHKLEVEATVVCKDTTITTQTEWSSRTAGEKGGEEDGCKR